MFELVIIDCKLNLIFKLIENELLLIGSERDDLNFFFCKQNTKTNLQTSKHV